MAENKEEILANFQSITGIEDVGEAFSHLEETQWDLMGAIQRVIPEQTTPMDSTGPNLFSNPSSSRFNRWSSAAEFRPTVPVASTSADADIIDLTSDMDLDSNKEHSYKFNIHFNQQIIPITLQSTENIANLKEKILTATKVPICRQAIRGWPPCKVQQAQIPSTILGSLSLASEVDLILIDITDDGLMEDESSEVAKRFEKSFFLNIVQQPEDKTIKLNLNGTQTILEVKTNVYYITNIPVRHQGWTGWPVGISNDTTLAESGIEYSHNLTLRSTEKPKNNRTARASNSGTVTVDSDSSADEFEDASDYNAYEEYFTDSPPVQAQSSSRHLIANNTDDEVAGSVQFVKNYMRRFGEPHPVFFQGSLEDALKEACHKPAKDRKLLAAYLHHGDSILTNVFCDHLLKHESVTQTLAQSFVLYGWDLTYESNKNLFLSSISACVSNTASMTVRNIQLDKLPAIMVVGKSRVFGRSSCEVISVIHGNVGLDDLLSRLMECIEMYSEQIQVEVQEENERAARDQVKYEQDMAYQETLQADMAKEAAKRQKEQELAAEQQRIEMEKAELEVKKEVVRANAERALPKVPSESTTLGITKIRFRLPTGEFLERIFFTENNLGDLLNFITSKGFPIDEYKVISSWPRRDLTTMDTNNTLQSLKLFPQETVILEER